MKACLFDIDGTLISTAGAGQLAFAQTFAEDFGVEELSGDVAFAGRSDRAIALDFFRHYGIPDDEPTWLRFHDGYTGRLATALLERKGEVLPGVGRLIARLEAMPEVCVGLLTGNVRRGAQLKLEHFGLWERFNFGGFGDHHTDRCDIARAAVEAARATLDRVEGNGHSTESVVVIGDTVHDIRCARSVGAKAVAVPTGGATVEELAEAAPDLLVENLEDSDQIVAWLAD